MLQGVIRGLPNGVAAGQSCGNLQHTVHDNKGIAEQCLRMIFIYFLILIIV